MGTPINSERNVAVSFSKLFSPLSFRHLIAYKGACPRTEDVIIDSQLRVAEAGVVTVRRAGKPTWNWLGFLVEL